MTAWILALALASTPVQPDFQCGADDAACWRRMVLWEYNHRVADENQLDDAQRALQHSEDQAACREAKNSRFGWGVAAGLALAIGGYLVFHH